MARHLMAVCVVCLLCAEHLPCKDHFEKDEVAQLIDKVFHTDNVYRIQESTIQNNLLNKNDAEEKMNKKRKGRTKDDLFEPLPYEDINAIDMERSHRVKRHGDHGHEEPSGPSETATIFLRKIFQQYGIGDGTTMNVEGFEKMLKRLNLYRLIEERMPQDEPPVIKQQQPKSIPSSSSSASASTSVLSNESCISSVELLSRLSSRASSTSSSDGHHHHDHDHQDATKLITNGHSTNPPTTNNKTSESNHDADHHHHDGEHESEEFPVISSDDMYDICPILLYQMAAPTSLERSGCIDSTIIPQKMYAPRQTEDKLYVWVYASVSVLGVSLVGLLGVAVIPCMDRHFYQYAIQFLVALAVGTLAGDALLHLLPHSMMTFTSKADGHASMTWKGLIAVMGIIFFFATERGLTMIAEWRKKIEKKEKPSSRVRVMRDPDSTSINNSAGGDKLCKHKYSSYPYCYDEIAMETRGDHHFHNHCNSNHNSNKSNEKSNNATTPISNHKNHNSLVYEKDHIQSDHNETAESLLPHNYSTISDNYSAINKEDGGNMQDNNTVSTNLGGTPVEGGVADPGENEKTPAVPEETYTIILREHESSHHGHSHKHGHVHSPPRTLSAVAWMVVMGDGLHNFTDGMAIGAAFSNNIAGGFSTAIAVFCHELPHELGDFAVLLKAGMSARQAVYYNLLSSVLSFFGMVLGVIVGDTPEASAWVFACAAGMFIYIALVDMMPELTSTHNERCALSQCLLHMLGMCTGLGIMLIIALYEENLKEIFSSADYRVTEDQYNN